jgi:hypothetical protein
LPDLVIQAALRLARPRFLALQPAAVRTHGRRLRLQQHGRHNPVWHEPHRGDIPSDRPSFDGAAKERGQDMSNDDESYQEFEDALSAVLTETSYDPARRHRLAKARSKVKRNDPRYVQALDRAFDAMEEVE